jgi:hypothetical protein
MIGRAGPSIAALAAAVAAACGGGGGGRDANFDSAPPALTVRVQHSVAFEGQQQFITGLFADGADLTGATVTTEPGSPLELVAQRCNRVRCGVVVRVRDTRPNMAIAFPAPIDGMNNFLLVSTPDGRIYRGLVTVSPLDQITNSSTEPIRLTRGGTLASSVDTIAASTFQANAEPIRWVIFGGGAIRGTMDASGDLNQGGGGHAGGEGPGAGRACSAGGGGGAGNAMDGSDGEAATPGGGGAGGPAQPADVPCLGDFDAQECGGSGGGGCDLPAAEGGRGGGSILIVSLAPLDLSGATIQARGVAGAGGAAGGSGAGGGAGGHIHLASHSLTLPAATDVSGGAGGTAGSGTDTAGGGAGSDGYLRFDAPGDAPAGALRGPAVDLGGYDPLRTEPVLTLTGRGEPMAELVVTDLEDLERATADVAADGTFSVDVMLEPGLNRFRLRTTGDSGELTFWAGTSLDFMLVRTISLPIAGVIDAVYIPPAE